MCACIYIHIYICLYTVYIYTVYIYILNVMCGSSYAHMRHYHAQVLEAKILDIVYNMQHNLFRVTPYSTFIAQKYKQYCNP
jgi:hypothetical protein